MKLPVFRVSGTTASGWDWYIEWKPLETVVAIVIIVLIVRACS